MNLNENNRAIGALVGLAVGDALGTTVEFETRDNFEPVTDFVGMGPFNLRAGEWTDDTSMAIALSVSLRETNGVVDERNLLDHFVGWYKNGHYSTRGKCFDIGNTTSSALNSYIRQGRLRAPDAHHHSGNGSIMRLAPAVIANWKNLDAAIEASINQGRVTHGSQLCDLECEKLARIIFNNINGIENTFEDTIVNKHRDHISSSGFVSATLEAAIWCFANTETFDDAVLLAANLGDDADTVAAVTGQIAGSFYGFNGIRQTWRERVFWQDVLVNHARELFHIGSR